MGAVWPAGVTSTLTADNKENTACADLAAGNSRFAGWSWRSRFLMQILVLSQPITVAEAVHTHYLGTTSVAFGCREHINLL